MITKLPNGATAFVCKRHSSGKIVKTKSGKVGYTKNSDNPLNGKIPVYFEGSDLKMLCTPESLIVVGYRD